MNEKMNTRDQEKRSEVLAGLRMQFGMTRWTKGSDESAGSHLLDGFLVPFFEVAGSGGEPDEAQMRLMMDAVRTMRNERQEDEIAPLLERGAADAENEKDTSVAERRRMMLAEVVSEHFRTGMQGWMSSMGPEHGVTETAMDDLERIRDEAHYKVRLVGAVQTMLQRELDAVELQIRAKQALAKS